MVSLASTVWWQRTTTRVLGVLGKRFGRYELKLHPDDALRRFPLQTTRWESSSENGWHDVHLSRLLPRMGQVAERQGHRAPTRFQGSDRSGCRGGAAGSPGIGSKSS